MRSKQIFCVSLAMAFGCAADATTIDSLGDSGTIDSAVRDASDGGSRDHGDLGQVDSTLADATSPDALEVVDSGSTDASVQVPCGAEGVVEVLACGVHPRGLVAADVGVVWFESGPAGCFVRRHEASGRLSTILAIDGCGDGPIDGFMSLAVSENDVYLGVAGDDHSEIIRINLAGGHEVLWNQQEATSLQWIAADSTDIYVALRRVDLSLLRADTEIRRMSPRGAAQQVLAQESYRIADMQDVVGLLFSNRGLILDESAVYWASSSTRSPGIRSLARNGDGTRIIAEPGALAPLAHDSSRVYFATPHDFVTNTPGSLFAAAKTGSGPAVRLESVNPFVTSISVDQSHVYWTETMYTFDPQRVQSGSLWRAPISGGPKEMLAGGPGEGITDVVVAGAAVYWLDAVQRKVKRRPK